MFESALEKVRLAAGAPLLAGLLLLAGCGGAAVPTCGSGQCTRVLFLGNSYTYVNDLPTTFARLAASGGRPIETSVVAGGGETLSQHAAASDSLSAISTGHWTYVVLQEQSETPATWPGRVMMYPAVRTLAGQIESTGATPMLFITWAHRDGLPAAGLADFDAMQQELDNAYLAIARELRVPVAPAGYAWSLVRRDHPDVGLWADDGSHPSAAGTYLAACVFYATIFMARPSGLSFDGGLGSAEARILQDEAGRAVLDNPSQWGLS